MRIKRNKRYSEEFKNQPSSVSKTDESQLSVAGIGYNPEFLGPVQKLVVEDQTHENRGFRFNLI